MYFKFHNYFHVLMGQWFRLASELIKVIGVFWFEYYRGKQWGFFFYLLTLWLFHIHNVEHKRNKKGYKRKHFTSLEVQIKLYKYLNVKRHVSVLRQHCFDTLHESQFK